ncbi:MAG: 16S rRNA (cytidine(1402)-2'-O)-methyltransferase [Rhodoferax sp.]|uniref:16S rRNA (cytidine(1402)-2'-O)-methyltransferase n=1 Tax=Rhodoferax sp. TaxID=50421 RepID=UPI001B45FF3B|nr:16S rRNA (cytidine(1402)-2'-O)-methyltransferase [Rhodoferax sp.]MBP9907427.1 16S rRNA (cytidine(1402)-2'-O)-methyltransferase [Rhodoferax sp.]
MSSHPSSLAVDFGTALRGASEVAANQNYPAATLYVMATPIGNLADITLRALHLLQQADAIACEDTRHSQALLRAYGIDKAPGQWLAVHQHNEAQAVQTVLDRLAKGQRVAYVSDAGTPAISDPGARLVAGVRQAGMKVVPVPGASSVTAVLSVAGVVADAQQSGDFVFAGFLPSKSGERLSAVQALADELRAVVLLEAPHRIEVLAQALATLGARSLTVGRELTKQFEELATLSAQDFPAWLAQDKHRIRGEFALVLHPVTRSGTSETDGRVLRLLLAELPLKTAVRLSAEITGESRNDLYALALTLKAATG